FNAPKECVLFGSSITQLGSGNLIMQNDADSPCPGVVATADPELGPLQINSPGNTPTMAILPTSPAYNAADDGGYLPCDQRGVTRPQFRQSDIGAYEWGGAAPIGGCQNVILRHRSRRPGHFQRPALPPLSRPLPHDAALPPRP